MTQKSERHHSLRWVLVPDAARASAGATVGIDADKLKHLKKVLRMEWDEPVRLTDGEGRVFEARLIQRGNTGAFALEKLLFSGPLARPVELVIGLPKNAAMDWIIEKAVECGVSAITPVVTSRSVVKLDKESRKSIRWQAIIDAAVEQSEQALRPLIAAPAGFREWLSSPGAKSEVSSFSFVSELREEDAPESALVRATWQKLTAAHGSVRVFIGPEGGMSSEEREALVAIGFEELSLGKTVLRVETAVISALTLLRVSLLSQ